MKRLIFALCLILTACSGPYLLDDDDANSQAPKQELKLWQVIQHKVQNSMEIHHEDKWYVYDVKLEGIQRNQFTNIVTSGETSMCPIGKAEYVVRDKRTSEIIRQETLFQVPCAPCHQR